MEDYRQLVPVEDYFDGPRHEGEVKMSTIRCSANYAGLFPVTPSDELPILSTTLENDRFPQRLVRGHRHVAHSHHR
jgi:hypothetical protein